MNNLQTYLIVVPIVTVLLAVYYVSVMERRSLGEKNRMTYLFIHIYVMIVSVGFALAGLHYWVWPSDNLISKGIGSFVVICCLIGAMVCSVRVVHFRRNPPL